MGLNGARRRRGSAFAVIFFIASVPLLVGLQYNRERGRREGMMLAYSRPNVADCGDPFRDRTTMSFEIAIVEDEPALRENYADAMRRQSYRVSTFASRAQAMAAFDLRLPDLVVIDVSLGDEPEGGFELCRELRGRSASLPIIFLTARDSELDAVSGLRLGADDYLTKDISLAHLMARIAALFRRIEALGSASDGAGVLERGDLRIDADRLSVSWQGTDVGLSLTEFWIVHALARYPGHVKSRQQLMDAANVVLDDATITSHVKRIRRKFDAIDSNFDAIQTAYGMGYRWNETAIGEGHSE